MLPALDERARWALVVLAGALLLVGLDAWWLATFRDGYPFDVDEAGYTSIALVDYLALDDGGLDAWWDAVQGQAPYAPLVPALASFVLLFEQGSMVGFVVLAGFLLPLGLSVYGIGTRLAGPRLGALAALVALTSPGVLFYSREFVFALPAAALLACAVYALLRSEALQRSGWAIACGAAIGLMLLARTMTVAFLPGLAAAGLLALLLRPRREWPRGILNGMLLLGATAVVAATWYWRNLQSVVDYLTDFGYGAESAAYGEAHAVLSWGWLRAVPIRIVEDDLLLPLAAVVLAGLLVALAAAVRAVLTAEDRRAAIHQLLSSEAVAVGLVVLAGYIVLSSSRNEGTGFTLPVAMLLPPLAVLALRRHARAAAPLAVLLVAIAGLNLAATSTAWDDLARKRKVDVPAFGLLPWLDGVPRAVYEIRAQVPGPETRFDGPDRGWPRASRELTRYLVEELGAPPLIAVASRNRAINTNTLLMSALLQYRQPPLMIQLTSDEGDTAAAYARPLGEPAYGRPWVLVTTSTNTGDYLPPVNQARVEAAARRLGFRIVRTMALPDGRNLHVWAAPDRFSPPLPAALRPLRASSG